MTYLEAAFEVLRKARSPLTTKEIVEAARVRGLLRLTGRTPERTMSAALYRALNGETDLIKIEEPGRVRALRGSVRWGLGSRHSGHGRKSE